MTGRLKYRDVDPPGVDHLCDPASLALEILFRPAADVNAGLLI